MMEQAPSVGPGSTAAAPPFKFLNYFEESDRASFAGREDEVQEVLTGLTRGRTYVLYARSGLGKTSLLLAGLFPQLRQRGFHPVRVRLLESPVEDFCAGLASEFQRPELAADMGPSQREALVPRVLEEVSAGTPLVIALDQFEEFFVRFRERPGAQAELKALLGRIARDSAASVRFLFILREDYYAELEDLRAELPDLTSHGLRLLPLTAYGARQAIVRPLQQAHVTYEEAFVNRLVDLLAHWNFEPPVLQIVCTELYRDVVARRGPPVHLTREDLERLGGVDGIFRGYVHRVTSGLDAERLLLVRVVLDALTSSEQTRYALRAEDVLAGPVRAEPGEIRAVLEHLVAKGLLRVERRHGERWYELLHEHLLSIVEPWLALDEDYVRFRATCGFVATMSEDPRWRTNPGWLLTAPLLDERVAPWKERLRLSESQTEFLLRSSIHERAESVDYWASRFDAFGEGRSERLVLGLLNHPDVSVRAGAAASCGRLRDASGRLTTRCLELALTDADEEVRRAAGNSFVRLARTEELAKLRGALSVPRQRGRVLDLLADLLESGGSLEGLPVRWRRQARAIVRARGVKRNQDAIRARSLNGARVGALAALVWCLTAGLVEGIYWVCTELPEEVTWLWPNVLVSWVLWLLVDNVVFVFVPVGLILGWRVARRAARMEVAQGERRWSAVVLRSGTLVLSSMVLYVVVLITFQRLLDEQSSLAQHWGVSWGTVFLVLLVVTSLLTWLLTVGVVWLVSRCITPASRTATLYVLAFLACAALTPLLEMLLHLAGWWVGISSPALTGAYNTATSSAALMANVQGFVICCVLAADPHGFRRAPVHQRGTSWARAGVVLGAVLSTALFFTISGTDTVPGLSGRHLLASEVSVDGRAWTHAKEVDYATVAAAEARPFVMSIHNEGPERTQFIVNGQEVTSGMLLASARSEFLTAVVSWPFKSAPVKGPRAPYPWTDYRYRLRREPVLPGGPVVLDSDAWAFSMHGLERVAADPGLGSSWRVTLSGRVPTAQARRAQGVLVLPVLVNITGLEPGACMGILSAPSAEGRSDTVILTNQAETAVVPPPEARTTFFTEGIRVSPRADGSWSTTLTLSPIHDFQPPECERPRERPAPLGVWSTRPPDLYGKEPSLLVAVKLY